MEKAEELRALSMTMLSSETLADLTAKYVAQNGPIETTAIIVRDPKATPFKK